MIFFQFFKKMGFLGILGPPYCGIGATIRIGREMLCLPYAGFFFEAFVFMIRKGLKFYKICFMPYSTTKSIKKKPQKKNQKKHLRQSKIAGSGVKGRFDHSQRFNGFFKAPLTLHW